METVMIGAQILGTVMSVSSALSQGDSQKRASQYEANQARVQAGQATASSQRQANEQRRQAQIAESRTVALAAAGGGSASDPTVQNIVGNIAGEGEYRALTALYQGEESARNLQTTANIKDYEGEQAQQAGQYKALNTVFSNVGSSFFNKYSTPYQSQPAGYG